MRVLTSTKDVALRVYGRSTDAPPRICARRAARGPIAWHIALPWHWNEDLLPRNVAAPKRAVTAGLWATWASNDGTLTALLAAMGRYLRLLLIGTITIAGCGGSVSGGNPGLGGTTAHPDSANDPSLGSGATEAAVAHCQCGTSSVAQMPLECACAVDSGSACPKGIDDYETTAAGICALGTTVNRLSGCGKIAFGYGAYAGSGPTFDAQSGALIGLYVFSDTGVEPCTMKLGIRYGDQLFDDTSFMPTSPACTSITTCRFCGPASPGIPPCN
jgi:hypothetical protein